VLVNEFVDNVKEKSLKSSSDEEPSVVSEAPASEEKDISEITEN